MLDDACFDKDQKNKLDQFFIDIKDEQWDAIFLNASKPMKDLNKWTIVNEQYLTGRYILSKKGAMTLLKLFEGQLLVVYKYLIILILILIFLD